MGRRSGVHLLTQNTRRNKKDIQRKVDEVDRISELPDHILASILSRLTLEEAVQTILLVRWRDLWIIRDTVLDFHDRRPVGRDYLSLAPQIQFIDWVDEVLEKHKEPTLNEFKVKSDWLSNSTLSERFFNWICFAIRKRVRRLDLALSSADYLSSLKLVRYRNLPPSSPHFGHPFPNLKFLISRVEGFSSFVTTLQVLRLRCFNVDTELLVYLLSKCPVLEHLSVSFSESDGNLQIQAPSVVKLKYFEIQNNQSLKTIHFDYAPNLECFRCFDFRVSVSIVSAPNLKYLDCFGYYENISIKSAPNLIHVCLGPSESYISQSILHLSNHFSQLEVLTLEVEGNKLVPDGLYFVDFPTLIHLKQLTLKLRYQFTCMDLNNLLRATPSLYRLHLEVKHKMPPLLESSRCRHECLKLVEWNGFTGDHCDYDVVKLLVATCKVLEKVKITKGETDPDKRVWLSKMEELAMQVLGEADVEVIIL